MPNWTRIALLTFIEAADALPGPWGPALAGLGTLIAELRQERRTLPREVQEALRALRDDYVDLFQAEGSRDDFPQALEAALAVLAHHGLDADELAGLNLDPNRAARQTLQNADPYFQGLERNTEDLARRLVRKYYRILLAHREALAHVGVPALAALLERTEDLEKKLARLLALDRLRARRYLRWPTRPWDPTWGLDPRMLRPEYRLVPFTGRTHEEARDELLAWLQGLAEQPVGRRVGVRLYVGPGGAGKTRLLLEVGEALRAAGWSTAFVAWFRKQDRGGVTQENAPYLVDTPAPTLLIVDYAGSREEEVHALLDALAAQRHRQQPCALVLLDRSEPPWWRKRLETGSDPGYTGRAELLLLPGVESAPHSLPQVAPEDLPALYQAGLEGLIRAISSATPPPATAPPIPLPRRPLYVLLLALLAAAGADRPQDTTDERSILDRTWRWVRERWHADLLKEEPGMDPVWLGQLPDLIEKLLVVTSLGRIFPDQAALAAFLAEQGRRPKNSKGERPEPDWLAELLTRLLPTHGDEPGVLPSIQPDPLADFVLARALDKDPALLDVALPTATELAADPAAAAEAVQRTLAVLQRLHDAAPDVARAGLDRAQAHLTAALAAAGLDPARAFLAALEDLLPNPNRTVFLRPLLAWLYRARLDRTPAEATEERAGILIMLGLALSALGRRQEALEATREAVALYRSLAQTNPEDFAPHLAMSLTNLGNRLSEVGRWQEALEAAQEAASLHRDLARAHPDAFLPDLSGILNNLGLMLSELGRRQEALEAAQKAVTLCRNLVQANPEAFAPDLALSLNNLGKILSELDRRQEALEAVQEAVALYRRLDRINPDAFAPDLARSLNNLGAVLAALGRRQEALEAAQEAVALYRRLAQDNPDAFLPYLALSLNNLGKMLSELDRRQEALEAAQEAVEIRRTLAQAAPEAFLPDLAMSVHNLGMMLSELGRRQEALEAIQEAVALYRRLAQAHPDAFVLDLAASLINLGNLLLALGRPQEAVEATREAVALYRDLAQAHPEAFVLDLAASLVNLGGMLSFLGRPREAVEATREAVALYRRLAQAHREAFLPYLASSLANLGADLLFLGRRQEALDAAQEAVALYRDLARAHPEAFLPYLAASLDNLGAMLSALGRRQEALEATREAVEIRRKLARAHPDAFLPDLARSLGALGAVFRAMDDHGQARTAFAEGIQVLTPLFLALPQALAELMSALVRDYVAACQALGVEPDAALLAPVLAVLVSRHEEA